MSTYPEMPSGHEFNDSSPSSGLPGGGPEGAPEPQFAATGDQPDVRSVRWDPPGHAFDELPPELRQAIDEVIRPAYEKLVRNAPPGLDQSTGITIVNLLWIEVVDHWRLGNSGILDRGITDWVKSIEGDSPDKIFGRLVQAVGIKLKASNVLRQLQQSRIQIARDRHKLMESLHPRQNPTSEPFPQNGWPG